MRIAALIFGFLLFMMVCKIIPVNAQVAPKNDLHIYFAFNSSQIVEKQSQYLSHFAAYLKKSKGDYKITISGYCDVVGDNPYNDQLSLSRANVVKDELVKLGINKAKIETINGWGKRKPVNGNKSDAEKQANRRVDVTLVLLDKTTAKKGLEKVNFDTVKEGAHLIIEDLHFYGSLHRLLPSSKPVLDTLVHILKLHPNLKISIQGHVCCTFNGEDGEDMETHTGNLSVLRAKEVNDYLIKNHIDPKRLSYKGLGGKYHLIDPEDTEESRVLNRRVEIVIVSR